GPRHGTPRIGRASARSSRRMGSGTQSCGTGCSSRRAQRRTRKAHHLAGSWRFSAPAAPAVQISSTSRPAPRDRPAMPARQSIAAIYEGGEPIAWALTHTITDRVGVIGIVHVLEGYRRKGLARSVVAAVVRELQGLGKRPTLHAYVDNVASLSLFPTLGFHKVKRQVWGEAVFR